MKIALFDYKVISTNAIGNCHRLMLQSLCHEHEFTVYAVEFENPCPNHVRWVRVPVPTRPLALLFVSYHLVAPLLYLRDRLQGERCDLVQFVESNLSFGDISYAHFCHRAYLRQYWPKLKPRGLRGFFQHLNHCLHALLEPWVYRRVSWIVVPSQGLKQELEMEYPFVRGRVHLIQNPVDLERMQRPADFSREKFRRSLGLSEDDLVLVFVALGHFERKGLPLLLEALRQVREPKLLVVGGTKDLVWEWNNRVRRMGLEDRVRFVGMQRDVRPFLWVSDIFAFPSTYEVFPLVALEAAAAGLPLLVTQLYGVEEFMRDGEMGFVIEGNVESIAKALRALASLPPEKRRVMGRQAQVGVKVYSVENFMNGWRTFFEKVGAQSRW